MIFRAHTIVGFIIEMQESLAIQVMLHRCDQAVPRQAGIDQWP